MSNNDNFAPISFERELTELAVQGELPSALRGSLYRNGPNPQFSDATATSHWFTGDGMIHAFHIEDGRVSYRNRWVRTDKWEAEHAAGRSLFRGFGGGQPPAGSDALLSGGVANTNIVWHGGRLLALEEAHLPTLIDPATLATQGVWRAGGTLKMPFTAHPKVDSRTGEMIFFGYSATGPFASTLNWGTLDPQGRVSRLEVFEAPYSSMVHDFIVTEHYVVLPILPLTGDLQRARSGRPPYAWEPAKGAYLGVFRRDTGIAGLIWLQVPTCYVFHVMNAWEENGRVVADLMQYDEPPLFPNVDGTPTRDATAGLMRWSIDPQGGAQAFTQTRLDDIGGEFPRFDERWSGRRNRHGYLAALQPRPAAGSGLSGQSFDTIAHLDLATGKRDLFILPEGDATSEPVFVPTGDGEGEGVLLAVVWRAAEQRSDLLILDAENLADGPIATARLPHRVPFGFHGNWADAA